MPTITILGGGVAGLALAATLNPTAYDVTLIERNPGYSRVPTAFGIWPFALAALERIKLADELRERGLLLTSGVITADSAHRPVTMTNRRCSWSTAMDQSWVVVVQVAGSSTPQNLASIFRLDVVDLGAQLISLDSACGPQLPCASRPSGGRTRRCPAPTGTVGAGQQPGSVRSPVGPH